MATDGSAEPTGNAPRRVVVKFRDAVVIPYEDRAERHVIRLGIGPWVELEQRFKGIRLDRLFTAAPPERIGELVASASDRDRRYRAQNLLTFFVIECPPGVEPQELAAAVREWTQVETAYVDPLDESPGPNDNPLYPLQIYLKPPAIAPRPAPQGGIDAEFAWTQPGGTGTGQKIVDLERGAKLDHEDFVVRNVQTLHGANPPNAAQDRRHGARSIGLVAAVDNAKGIIGIAYGLDEVAYSSQVLSTGGVDRPNAVLAAIQHFTQAGDDPVGRVLLLEVQIGPANDLGAVTDANGVVWNFMPMETAAGDFAVIRLATALGITVVEAAGNGVNNLDNFREAASGTFVFARTRPSDFRDSGAVMVGGSTSTYPYHRSIVAPDQGTNFGSRIDCFAWADGVQTCDVALGTGADTYTGGFDGTSAASGIVAGAALLVQGAAEAGLARRLSPGELRVVLSDPAINTRSANYGVDLIGVMPNLKRILQDALGVAPDVYMRDYVGDTGEVHAGAISMSPDVIVRPAPVADPAVTFGPGTEGDLMLGPTATAGQDNFVYVRVWNRGGVAATNVTATVYYAAPATLLTPVDWTRVGSVVLANVPLGRIMTVSAAIVWPAANVPPPGHYCFVALVGCPRDPAPQPAAFLNFDNYYVFIRNNNNVTWRNFDVVTAPTPGSPGLPSDGDAYAFDFAAPGAADVDRYFALAVGSSLPPGARVALEVPLTLLDDHVPSVEVDHVRRIGRVAITPHGRTMLPAVVFAARSRSQCRLLVSVPRGYRTRDYYEVYVSQLYEGFEVGRITWRIAARA